VVVGFVKKSIHHTMKGRTLSPCNGQLSRLNPSAACLVAEKILEKWKCYHQGGLGNLKSVAGSSSSSLCAIFCHFAHRFCFCSQLLLYFRHRRRRLADVLARAVSHVGVLRERGSWSLLNRGARILDPGKRDWGPMRLSVAL